jgi:hypothetical protein
MNKMYKACFQPVASDDVSKDMVLKEKLALTSFVRPEHLDIPPECCQGEHIKMAEKELCKMDAYKARPRTLVVLTQTGPHTTYTHTLARTDACA